MLSGWRIDFSTAMDSAAMKLVIHTAAAMDSAAIQLVIHSAVAMDSAAIQLAKRFVTVIVDANRAATVTGSKILMAMVIKIVNRIVAVLESTNGYETETESAKGYVTVMESSNGPATVTERFRKDFFFFFVGEIGEVDFLLDFLLFPLNHFRSTSSKSGRSGV